ncbi:MAG TPA: Gfo/Idh/MocA family oxidoreductase [Acidimicrobiia bacterium]|nr:Gfo/Idh/MocA family oxidoreductase [Acidimicrobiia bacterium]
MTRLGVAVVGCGFQGGIHARNVTASPRADLVACADIDVDRAARLAAETGTTWSTDRLSDIWQDPSIDVVVVATTTNTHHELALEAARHGKHMLVEKPMAITVEECLEIERACAEANVVAVLGYKFRFTEAVVAARAAVPRPRVLLAQTLYDPAPAGANPWVNDRAVSGGRLVSSLVHAVDLLRFLSGDEVERVFAEPALVAEQTLGEPDTTVATLVFGGGSIASLVHGTAGASGVVSTWSFQAADAGVNATIHDHGRRLVVHRPGADDTTVVDPCPEPFEAGTAPLLEALVAAVTGEEVDVPGPRDGTLSLLISRCIEEAMETGQPVTVPEL